MFYKNLNILLISCWRRNEIFLAMMKIMNHKSYHQLSYMTRTYLKSVTHHSWGEIYLYNFTIWLWALNLFLYSIINHLQWVLVSVVTTTSQAPWKELLEQLLDRLISEVQNGNNMTSSSSGFCLVTTKTSIHCRHALYYVITQMAYYKLTWIEVYWRIL